jgi:nucleoside-diphosphate-sugar epimerase
VESVLGRNLFGPAIGKTPAVWVGEWDQPLGPTYVADFAHGLAELGVQEAALGKAWHLPTPPPTTARAFFGLVFTKAERPMQAVRLTSAATRALGLASPLVRDVSEVLYQFRQPHSVDATAYRTAFGPGQVTSYEQGIEDTLTWYRTMHGRGGRGPAGSRR